MSKSFKRECAERLYEATKILDEKKEAPIGIAVFIIYRRERTHAIWSGNVYSVIGAIECLKDLLLNKIRLGIKM